MNRDKELSELSDFIQNECRDLINIAMAQDKAYVMELLYNFRIELLKRIYTYAQNSMNTYAQNSINTYFKERE